MRQSLLPRPGTTTAKLHASRLKLGLAVFVATSSLVCACASRESVKGPEAPSPSTAASPSQQLSQTPPPKLVEVQEVVQRVFKDAALVDSSRIPDFLAGDFNGDGSQDIAVVLRPAPGKLSEMNQDLPAWILRDLFSPAQPGMPSRPINTNDVLLALIHGYGPNGWRDPQATQTYLLKNAVGSDVKTSSKSEFVTANQGKKIPRLFGDLIGEVLRGRSGYLYFAEATYSWYDPKTFKGEPEKRLVHQGAEARTEKSALFNLKARKEIAVEK